MITDERLQEIKSFWSRDVSVPYVEKVLAKSDIEILIAALEASQAENERLRADKRRETYG